MRIRPANSRKPPTVIKARKGVVSNASVWDTQRLLPDQDITPKQQQWSSEAKQTPQTGSFMHLHLGQSYIFFFFSRTSSSSAPPLLPCDFLLSVCSFLDLRSFLCSTFPCVLSPALLTFCGKLYRQMDRQTDKQMHADKRSTDTNAGWGDSCRH